MKLSWMISSIALGIVCLLAPLTAGAESASRTGDAANFLDGAKCPGPEEGQPCFDPQAGGTKLTGTLSVVWDKGESPLCTTTPFVKNMYVNITLDQGNVRLPFTADYLNGPPRHETGFCMLTNTLEQVKVMTEVIRKKVIPFFFTCDADSPGSCPTFKIKAITNFQYAVSQSQGPNTGGFSADITVAVP